MDQIGFKVRILQADRIKEIEPTRFIDVIINGKSLYKKTDAEEANLAGAIGFFEIEKKDIKLINEFLIIDGPESETNRVALFVCRACGDIGCGAISLQVRKTENSFIWEDFAWDDGKDEIEDSDIIDVESFEFERSMYENEFNNLINNKSYWQ